MPIVVQVHKDHSHGTDNLAVAVSKVQAVLSLPVNRQIDRQHLAGKIIDMQKALVTAGKLSASKVSVSIDDQQLTAKLTEVENAANT